MDRREFIKASLATGLLAILEKRLPFQEKIITIIDVDLKDGWEKAISFGGIKSVNGQAQVEVSLDMEQVWPYVIVTCDDGETIYTPDGKIWIYSGEPKIYWEDINGDGNYVSGLLIDG